MKKILLIFAFVLLCSISVSAQNVRYDNTAINNTGNFLKAIPGPTITVCSSSATGIPCSPTISVCSSATDVVCSSPNPFTGDANGNYGFWLPPGNYVVSVTGSGITGYSSPISILSNANLLTLNNAFTGNNTHSGTETFTGALLAKNLESIRFTDQFAGATLTLRTQAAINDCGVNACIVAISSGEPSTDMTGLLTVPSNITLWDLRSNGWASQSTNMLLCDGSQAGCQNPGGPQVFQAGRTFTSSPANGNQGGTFRTRWTGISANTLAFPLDSLGVVAEVQGLTQSNGSPAPVIGLDNVAAVYGNNTNIANWRIYSTDPGGLANAGTGNTITNMYGYYGQNVTGIPAGLTVTNWYNAWMEYPGNTGITNAWAAWLNGRTTISEGTTPVGTPLFNLRGAATGGSPRSSNILQAVDTANSDTVYFSVRGDSGDGRVVFVQPPVNGMDFYKGVRKTDASPAGFFLHLQKADFTTDVYKVDINGATYQLEGTAPGGGVGLDICGPDSTAHAVKCSFNNDTSIPLTRAVASGTSTMTSGTITAATCQTAVTTAATGTATTDAIEWAYATAPTLTTDALLTISPYVTSGNVNFTRCNPTAGSITGTAIVINWRVIR